MENLGQFVVLEATVGRTLKSVKNVGSMKDEEREHHAGHVPSNRPGLHIHPLLLHGIHSRESEIVFGYSYIPSFHLLHRMIRRKVRLDRAFQPLFIFRGEGSMPLTSKR